VEFLPHRGSGKTSSRGIRARTFSRRAWGRVGILASAATLVSFALPSGIGNADPVGTPTSLQATVSEANVLSNQIDELGQQYDALKIQLTEAREEAAIAKETTQRDQQALGAGQAQVGQLAAEGYMMGGFDPTIQLLQNPNPQQFLDRASIMLQLQYQQGGTMSLLQSAEDAANRAKQTATQEEAEATTLSAAMSKKVSQIQQKENVLNSSAFSQALQIFDQTGSYPNIQVSGDTLGEQALRFALTRLGDEYVWGGAGPDVFDCSGLVMWAYAHVGISLAHFTGDQWNEGEHISRSQLEPGDLVFFFADISHVGLYIGNGMMVDAPTFGQPVQIQPVMWDVYVGAVRIVA
jgi:cell wall-associated NlpC family hydrolase